MYHCATTNVSAKAAINRLKKLRELESGWDGASASTVSSAALGQAELFLASAWRGPEPDVGPDYDGSVVMEWDRGGPLVAMATFQPDGTIRVHVFDDRHSVADTAVAAAVDAAKLLKPFMVNSASAR